MTLNNHYHHALNRVEDILSLQVECLLSEDNERLLAALQGIFTYAPISFFTVKPPAFSDIEALDGVTQTWLVNFVNNVTVDWVMMLTTADNADAYDDVISNFLFVTDAIKNSDLQPVGFGDRISIDNTKDPVTITYYLLAQAYRSISLKLGATNGRTATKPVP